MAVSNLTKIGANTTALRALSAFSNVNAKIEGSQERLATGKRINSAGDDPAGYQLSRILESRSRGLGVALDNVSNTQSVLNVAEGGYQNIQSILQTMKEKATQAADGNLNSTQRSALNDQVSALISEVDDIVGETTFNGSGLIDGTFSSTVQTGETASNTLTINLQDSDSAALSINTISLSSQASASSAVTSISNAITSLAQSTQDVGEYKSRLSAKENTLSVAITNTEGVRSNIEDADFAKEQMEMLKTQILQQTSLTSLAQANSGPQIVLSLFG